MVFKVSPGTQCQFLFKPLIKITRLASHSENLVKATVKNIMVATIKTCKNPSLIPFVESFAFHDFQISIVKELLTTTEDIERLILTPKQEKQLQNKILDLGDLLDYFRDLLLSLSEGFRQQFNFLLFLFQLFYVVQLLLPLLRYDLKIKPQVNIGLNCGLFVLNRLLELTERLEDLERACLAPLFFRNKVLGPWVKTFDFRLIESPEEIVDFYYSFSSNLQDASPKPIMSGKFSLFPSEINRKIKRVSSQESLGVLRNPRVKIDIGKKLVPRVFNVVSDSGPKDLSRKSLIFRESKLLNCLVSFLKTKDDNMLLLSTNIILQVMPRFRLHESVKQEIADRCSENLASEVKFRMITFENIAKLLAYCVTHDYRAPQRKVVDSLKERVAVMKQITEKSGLNLKFAPIFRKVCREYDSGEQMFAEPNLAPRQRSLNYLSLINYSFYEDLSKLKYLSIFFKYHLTDAEIMDIEIRKFLVLKNLRYSRTSNRSRGPVHYDGGRNQCQRPVRQVLRRLRQRTRAPGRLRDSAQRHSSALDGDLHVRSAQEERGAAAGVHRQAHLHF